MPAFEYALRELAPMTRPGADLQEIINGYVSNGWEYYDSIRTTKVIPPGCLMAIFGVKPDYVMVTTLVFRRQVRA